MNLVFFTRNLNWTVGLDIQMWIHYITRHVNLGLIITAFVNHRSLVMTLCGKSAIQVYKDHHPHSWKTCCIYFKDTFLTSFPISVTNKCN